MKLALALSFIAGASAFAPQTNNAVTSTTVLQDSPYENSLGAVEPTGFFDPLGISDSWDAETFDRYQNGEITNGRAAMLAVIGYIAPEYFRLPGEISPGLKFADVPNGVEALKVLPGSFWVTLSFFIGSVNFLNYERTGSYTEWQEMDMDAETFATRRQNEISNGRLAMLAFWELVRHDITREAGVPVVEGPFAFLFW